MKIQPPATPETPMRIRLLQNCITPAHFASLIPGFEALDFRENPRPNCREFQVFEHVHQQRLHRESDLLGALSTRFQAKSRMDGHDVRRWIAGQPGQDVYVVNPLPQLSYANFNSNVRSAIIHRLPDFSNCCQRVLDKAGVPLEYEHIGRQHNGNYGLCSFWVGSPRFWDKLVSDLIAPVIKLSRSELGCELHDFLHRPLPYYGSSTHRPGGLPFLLERATNMFIQAEFAQSSVFYRHTRQEVLDCCVFPFERDCVQQFGDAVDAWDAEGRYDTRAMAYFDNAARHSGHGWLAYMDSHSIDFDHGDPRPDLPWFRSDLSPVSPDR